MKGNGRRNYWNGDIELIKDNQQDRWMYKLKWNYTKHLRRSTSISRRRNNDSFIISSLTLLSTLLYSNTNLNFIFIYVLKANIILKEEYNS